MKRRKAAQPKGKEMFTTQPPVLEIHEIERWVSDRINSVGAEPSDSLDFTEAISFEVERITGAEWVETLRGFCHIKMRFTHETGDFAVTLAWLPDGHGNYVVSDRRGFTPEITFRTSPIYAMQLPEVEDFFNQPTEFWTDAFRAEYGGRDVTVEFTRRSWASKDGYAGAVLLSGGVVVRLTASHYTGQLWGEEFDPYDRGES